MSPARKPHAAGYLRRRKRPPQTEAPRPEGDRRGARGLPHQGDPIIARRRAVEAEIERVRSDKTLTATRRAAALTGLEHVLAALGGAA